VGLIHLDLAGGPASLGPPAPHSAGLSASRPAGLSASGSAEQLALDDFDGPVAALRYLAAHLDLSLEEPPFALVAGLIGGSGGPGTARCAAVGVSPLSGAVAETRAEGPFAAGLRAAGATGIVLHGRAPEPVCVVVADGRAWTEPAGDLWGSETGPATDRLLERYGAGAAVAVIGTAGERRIPYASIVTGRHHPLPRLGLGAVLGAKNVKAIVAVGDATVPVADPVALARLAADYADAAAQNKLTVWQRAMPGFGVWAGEPGYAPVAGFTDTTRGGGLGVVPDAIAHAATVAACPGCPTDCIKVYAGAGLHQEALAMLGPNLGVADPWPLLARCEQLGLDPVEVGAALAAAAVPPDDVPAAVEQLATGAFGHPVVAAAGMRSKGVAIPPFDPRVQPNLGLAYAVSPIGPRYDLVEHDLDFDPVDGLTESFPEMRRLGVEVPRPRGVLDVDGTAQLMRLWSGLDALGVCLFAATPTRPLRLALVEDLVEAVTGRRPDLLGLGATRLRMQFAINRRLGLGPAADTLPDLFFTQPVRAGRYAGAVLDRAAFEAATAALRDRLEADRS
jgi:aldehyde:ferredoxin oxidoreductase